MFRRGAALRRRRDVLGSTRRRRRHGANPALNFTPQRTGLRRRCGAPGSMGDEVTVVRHSAGPSSRSGRGRVPDEGTAENANVAESASRQRLRRTVILPIAMVRRGDWRSSKSLYLRGIFGSARSDGRRRKLLGRFQARCAGGSGHRTAQPPPILTGRYTRPARMRAVRWGR
jgi:hypothetical protein